MRSFFWDDEVTEWMKEVRSTCFKPDYLSYAYKAQQWLLRTPPIDQRPLVPSEMWIDSQKELKAFSIKTDLEDRTLATPENDEEEEEWEQSEGLRRELVSGVMNKNHWDDGKIKQIMAARKLTNPDLTGSCEYLNVTGQKIRHDFTEGVMYQMIKQRRYESESHYRMHKYVISRCILEIILHQNDVYCPSAGVRKIDDAMDAMKYERLKTIHHDKCIVISK